MGNFGSALLASLHDIVANPVRHMTGNSEAIRNFAKTLKLNVAVSVRYVNSSIYTTEIKMNITEGRIPDISKGDFDLIYTMIETV
jgi:phosphoribosylformylglycinamidine (FGAM) synthase-like amidotransferase family enzyme